MKTKQLLEAAPRFVLSFSILSTLLWLVVGARPGAERIHGVSFVGSRQPVSQEHIDPVLRISASHAAVMPFAFMRATDTAALRFNSPGQWYGERAEGVRQYMKLLKANGIQIMVKPQIWIWGGTFTGEIAMASEAQWKDFEASYREFILLYARLAEEEGAEIFCIGTELDRFVQARSGFWEGLIGEVRKVFSGKLTYAANWDEYTRVPFWGELDYIGVDAYFPLSPERDPDAGALKQGWQRWKADLRDCSKAKGKPVLFTEYGYRSMDYSAHKPWLVDRNEMKVNTDLQARAYEVLYEELCPEDWFAGGFLWKWFIDQGRAGGPEDNRFTPQNKEAESVVAKHYGMKEYRTEGKPTGERHQ